MPIRPCLSQGHIVRAAERDSLAHVAAGSELRFEMTCWRRLRDWQEAGIWQLIHFSLLDWPARCSEVEWSRAIVDSCSVRAVLGGSDRSESNGPSQAGQ
jgi:hypothetical protein